MVIAIIAVLLALILPAVQNVRAAAARLSCSNNLRQMALASHQYHDTQGHFPHGVATADSGNSFPWLSWQTRLLPWLEQEALWRQTQVEYQRNANPLASPFHTVPRTLMRQFGCPADARTSQVYGMYEDTFVLGLTSYLGVQGLDAASQGGLLFANSRVAMTHIPDGLSNTLLIGERPASVDLMFGWWYAANGVDRRGTADMVLGVRERHTTNRADLAVCPRGPYHFRPPESPPSQCDLFHFWSLHHGGAHFAMADGSVHFLRYSADSVLPALATRAGGEVASLP